MAIENAELLHYRTGLITSSPNGIIAVDREGNITEYNPRAQEILGRPRDEVMHKSVKDLYFDPQEPRTIGRLLHENGGRLINYKTAVKGLNGEQIPILHSSTWLYSGGLRVGSVGYFEDLRPRQRSERRERLLLEVIDLVAKARDLDEGLQQFAEKMVALLGCSFCSIMLMDESGEFLSLRGAYRGDQPKWRPPRGRPQRVADWPGLRELLIKGRPLRLKPYHAKARPTLDRLAKRLGFELAIESLLVVPLKIEDRVVGQLDLGDLAGDSQRLFSAAEEIELVSAIAAQLKFLLKRLRDLESTERREKSLKNLAQVTQKVNRLTELPALLWEVPRLAGEELFPGTVAGLFLNRPNSKRLELAAVHGLNAGIVGTLLPYSEILVGSVAQNGEPQIEHEYLEQCGSADLLAACCVRSALSVPLRKPSGEVDAVLFIGDTTGDIGLTDTDVEILERFAAQGSIALQVARLIGSEKHIVNRLTILHHISDFIQATENEEQIFHAILTGVTASYGLGFNRAILLLLDETGRFLIGRKGIGEIKEERARLAWRNDELVKMNDFGRFLERLRAGAIESSTLDKVTRSFCLSLENEGPFSEAIQTRQPVEVTEDQLDRLPTIFCSELDLTSHLVIVPLLTKEKAIGLLAVDNKFTRSPIGPDLVDSLIAFANTAAIALENNILLRQTLRERERLESFYRVSSEVVQLKDPKRILERIAEQTYRASEAAGVSILLFDSAGRIINPLRFGIDVALQPEDVKLVRPDGRTREAMRTGKVVRIENVQETPNVNLLMQRRGIRAALCIPICVPSTLPEPRVEPFGVMWIHYDRPRRFSDFEINTLEFYASHAAIAYESALRLHWAERIREATESLATAENMQQVLECIVESAKRVLDAQSAILWIYDAASESFLPERSVRTLDVAIEHWDWFRQEGRPKPRRTAYRVMQELWIGVADITQLDESELPGKDTRELLHRLGGRGFQAAALRIGDEKLGVLYAVHKHPLASPNAHRDAALEFAKHAAWALKKAKLLDQVKRATAAAKAVAKVTALGAFHDTLTAIATETRQALSCKAVVLFKYDDKNGLSHPPAMSGVLERSRAENQNEQKDYDLVQKVLEMSEGDWLAVPKTAAHSDFRTRRFTRDEGVRSCFALPLHAVGRKVGVMFVNYDTERDFTQDEISTIRLFAHQAAIAIQNTQLYEELRSKFEEQKALAELSQALLRTQDSREMMNRSVAFAAEKLRTEFANLVLENERGELIFEAGFGWESEFIGMFLGRGRESQTGLTMETETAVIVKDFTLETRFKVPDIVTSHSIHSALSVPIFLERIGRLRVVGAMLVHSRKKRDFDDHDLTLLRLIANETAMPIVSAKLREAEAKAEANKALAWIGIADAQRRHEAARIAGEIREQISNLSRELEQEDAKSPRSVQRLVTIGKIADGLKTISETPSDIDSDATSFDVNELLGRIYVDLWVVNNLGLPDCEFQPIIGESLLCRISIEFLRRALRLLIDNAVDEVRQMEGGKIWLSSRMAEKEGRVEIWVEDNGRGIPKEIRNQVLYGIVKSDKGWGIGLMAARAMVEMYGGTLRWQDRDPTGTTMIISLPIDPLS